MKLISVLSKNTSKTIEQTASKKIEQTASNQIEQIVIKQKEIAINQISYIPYFKYHLENIPKLLTTLLGKSTPKNNITEQTAQVPLLIETGGSEKFLVGIAHPFRT